MKYALFETAFDGNLEAMTVIGNFKNMTIAELVDFFIMSKNGDPYPFMQTGISGTKVAIINELENKTHVFKLSQAELIEFKARLSFIERAAESFVKSFPVPPDELYAAFEQAELEIVSIASDLLEGKRPSYYYTTEPRESKLALDLARRYLAHFAVDR